MADINGVKFTVEGSPDIYHTVTYKKSRPNNSQMTYVFTVKSSIVYSDGWIGTGTGYGLNATFTVNGTSATATMKSESTKWSYGNTYTTTVTVTCPSTTANSTQAVTFAVKSTGTLKSGTMSNSSYTVTSSALLYTACTSPTTFTTSASPFESSVTLTWSGASGGTNNSIASYYIQYCVSNDASAWGSWIALTTVASTATSGTYTKDMSSLVTRGQYVKFKIRTQGSAGSGYYSGYKESSSIRRNPYTTCVAPTSFTITPDSASSDGFNTTLTFAWSGASGGTNNAISSYLIQYNVSSNGSTWNGWTNLATISTNATYGSYTHDMSSLVARGYYVDFQIRTQGSADSSYYSAYKDVAYVRRNPYTKCGAPTVITLASAKDLNGVTHNDIFETGITVSWSGATAGSNNAISKYQLDYRTSLDNATWSGWTTSLSQTSTIANMSFSITRGAYIQFRVKTVGTQSGYDSDYKTSGSIRRNSDPSKISSVTVTPSTLEYSKGDNITISWSKPSDIDNNIYKYRVRLYPNIANTSTYYDYETTNTSFTLLPTDSHYASIENNQQLRFSVKPIDIFGRESAEDTQSSIITHYEATGILMGVNGKWVNYEVKYGHNGKWVDVIAYVGIDNNWAECGE